MPEIDHDLEHEIHMANYIMLRRINDVLMLLLRNASPEDADIIAAMHEEGIFASPSPVMKGEPDG